MRVSCHGGATIGGHEALMDRSLSPTRRIAASMTLAGLLTLLVALPVAVDLTTSLETLYRARPENARAGAIELNETVSLAPPLGLVLHRAWLTALGAGADPRDPRSRRLVLSDARIVADFEARRTATSPAQIGSSSDLSRIAAMDYDSLLVRRGEVEVLAGDGRRLGLRDVTAEITTTRRGSFTIDGTGSLNGHRLRLSGRWSSDPDQRAGGGPVPVTFEVRSNLLEASFDGELVTDGGPPRLKGRATMKARKMRALARWLGVPVAPSTDLRGASISGSLDWSHGVISFARADVELDGNKASGSLILNTLGARPAVEGTLGFRVLDLGPYIASVTARSDEPASTSADAGEYRSLLAAFDADLRLSAAKVTAPLVETGRGAMTIAVRQGRLRAELAELEIEGGHARGQITVEAGNGTMRLGLRGKLLDIDPGRVFAQHLERTPLFGRAELSLDLWGSGPDLPTALATMSGKSGFKLPQAGRLALDLNALLHAAKTTPIVGWSAAGKGSTRFDRLEGRAALANGAILIEALDGRAGVTAWTGSGKIDLTERLVDLVLTHARASAVDAGGDARESLAIRGRWPDPAISLVRQPAAPSAAVGAGASAPTQQLRN